MITGESKIGRSEQRVEPCGTPLFGKDFVIGVCKSCRDGWDVEGNRIIQTPENLELIEKAKLLAE